MTRNPLRYLGPIALALVVTACGPTREVSLSMKSVPAPILLRPQPSTAASVAPTGTGPAPTQPQPPPLSVFPGLAPTIYAPGSGGPEPPAAPIAAGAPACADLSPFAVPAHAATPSIATTAIQGAYAYRNSGDINGALPPGSVHTVSGASEQDTVNQQVLQFTDTEKIGSRTIARTFRVINATASSVVSGELDLTSISDSAGPSVTFQPGLELLKTPADTGVNWQSAATGYSTGGAANYRVTAAINQRQLVNACGQAVDGWNVTGTESVVGPLDNITFNLDYNVATGYGGLIVREVRTADSGEFNGAPYSEHLTSIISQANPS